MTSSPTEQMRNLLTLLEAGPSTRTLMEQTERGGDLAPLFVAVGYPEDEARKMSVESRANAGSDPGLEALLDGFAAMAAMVRKYGVNEVAQQCQKHEHEFWYDRLTKQDWAELDARAEAKGGADGDDGGPDSIALLRDNGIHDLKGLDAFLGHKSVASTISEITDKIRYDDEEMIYYLNQIAGHREDDEDHDTLGPMILRDTGELGHAWMAVYEKLYRTRPDVRGRDW